jgi:tRNA(His) 5'-end guanylyltransferase
MKQKKDSLGDRMKGYEQAFRYVLPRRMPLLLRLDGVAFHTFTRGLDRPFDELLVSHLNRAAAALCESIAGAKIAYVQSDEISVLVHTYTRLQTQPWFGNEVQKIASVSAAIVSSHLSRAYNRPAIFDSRAWILPEAEVCNYFLWRQQDASRNSLSRLLRSHYSAAACFGQPASAQHEMLYAKGVNWNDLPTRHRRGRCVLRTVTPGRDSSGVRPAWTVDDEIPIFSQDRAYIERHLALESENQDGG